MKFLSPEQTYHNLQPWCFSPIMLSLLQNVFGIIFRPGTILFFNVLKLLLRTNVTFKRVSQKLLRFFQELS